MDAPGEEGTCLKVRIHPSMARPQPLPQMLLISAEGTAGACHLGAGWALLTTGGGLLGPGKLSTAQVLLSPLPFQACFLPLRPLLGPDLGTPTEAASSLSPPPPQRPPTHPHQAPALPGSPEGEQRIPVTLLSVDHSTPQPAAGPGSLISGPQVQKPSEQSRHLPPGGASRSQTLSLTGATVQSFCFLVRISHVIQMESLGFGAKTRDPEEWAAVPVLVGRAGEPHGV